MADTTRTAQTIAALAALLEEAGASMPPDAAAGLAHAIGVLARQLVPAQPG